MNALWDDYSSGSKDRRRLLESRYGRCNLVVTMESRLSQEWIAVTCKNCPYCFSRIEKNGGCNRMTCSRCSRQFCWACLTKLTYENNHQHFSHDSPCTIWAWLEKFWYNVLFCLLCCIPNSSNISSTLISSEVYKLEKCLKVRCVVFSDI
uniref:RING-type domain-containing protein n=1 Tax=Sphaeramia orbicularis TaxID=375764 RepID=A0A673CKA2_9TELE